ncbi:hypothetical protein OIV83_001914 [Microbotryomycetes sp. JL201]|nr:hypothetical protein OIV83_001914 [Microbotryomycetes sp. JL201]
MPKAARERHRRQSSPDSTLLFAPPRAAAAPRDDDDDVEDSYSLDAHSSRHLGSRTGGGNIHTGIRPYACPYPECPKESVHVSDVLVPPFADPMYLYSFCRKTTLTKHIHRNHSVEYMPEDSAYSYTTTSYRPTRSRRSNTLTETTCEETDAVSPLTELPETPEEAPPESIVDQRELTSQQTAVQHGGDWSKLDIEGADESLEDAAYIVDDSVDGEWQPRRLTRRMSAPTSKSRAAAAAKRLRVLPHVLPELPPQAKTVPQALVSDPNIAQDLTTRSRHAQESPAIPERPLVRDLARERVFRAEQRARAEDELVQRAQKQLEEYHSHTNVLSDNVGYTTPPPQHPPHMQAWVEQHQNPRHARSPAVVSTVNQTPASVSGMTTVYRQPQFTAVIHEDSQDHDQGLRQLNHAPVYPGYDYLPTPVTAFSSPNGGTTAGGHKYSAQWSGQNDDDQDSGLARVYAHVPLYSHQPQYTSNFVTQHSLSSFGISPRLRRSSSAGILMTTHSQMNAGDLYDEEDTLRDSNAAYGLSEATRPRRALHVVAADYDEDSFLPSGHDLESHQQHPQDHFHTGLLSPALIHSHQSPMKQPSLFSANMSRSISAPTTNPLDKSMTEPVARRHQVEVAEDELHFESATGAAGASGGGGGQGLFM